ncbi:MAG: DEAD/DEAH box helicase [Acidiphilium sp. 37-64-53]|uniref:DEAD/DEAH box helicase n=1 Tax=Acidiphilium TaxID=522 RepID=UPI000BD2F35D|nr:MULTISPECIES: DEAD/DEAH box helicase [Acidiphilium]OYW00283.1 MAG: DEAD/DEAH box helicase [Acidiphilium sp. 37-64-53]OZB24608.1 MAG: DEAD/DEAH box helicase [Acidiphilium sp. 34-64-41]HQT86586.1 DEAD/DEAH box helicase [Acidiphilium rubrum]
MKAFSLTLFTDLGLAEPVIRAVTAESYTTPTPIQAQSIPIILEGHDLVGIAQTGTGKTAAFVLPILHRLVEQRTNPGARGCRTLILAPTRELASQIADAARVYGKFIRPSVAVVIGGAKPGPQARQMMPGVDLLVATPGRLLDHVSTGAIRLDGTEMIVLDEADQMLDLGFMPAIRKIMSMLPSRRQAVMFSATMPKPIRALAAEFLRNPREVSVSVESKPIDRIDQRVMLLSGEAKKDALVTLMKEPGVERAIVFTRTKHGADKVCRHLEAASIGASAIHGNKSQSQRERALDQFRQGRIKVLVATDIAARGIDVDGISHVVNFELPNIPESYVHRIGRTARAGTDGIAVSFVEPAELTYLRDIERLIGKQLIPGGAVPARGVVPPHLNRANNQGRNGGGGQNRSGGAPKTGHSRPQQRSHAAPARGRSEGNRSASRTG